VNPLLGLEEMTWPTVGGSEWEQMFGLEGLFIRRRTTFDVGATSSLAEFGLDEGRADELRMATTPHPEWPETHRAPHVSQEEWGRARTAVAGLPVKPHALRGAAAELASIHAAVRDLGVPLDAVQCARLVHIGSTTTAAYIVFARHCDEGVCFTISWIPPLMTPYF
jgi:hypothetical protein